MSSERYAKKAENAVSSIVLKEWYTSVYYFCPHKYPMDLIFILRHGIFQP